MHPGLYTDIPLLAYHAAPGLSKSDLDWIARSPAHWKYGERVTTPAMRLGAAVHAAVLEPDQWEHRYVRVTGRRPPNGDADPDPVRLTTDEWETCLRIRDAVWNHPTCRDLFSEGYAEQSAWWLDPETCLLYTSPSPRDS